MKEHRVVGPPGCGKTTYLSRQFANATKDGYNVADLFACSLTRAAAAEIASRVEGVPARNVGTLHSHAYRQLKYPKIVETTQGLKAWNEHAASSFRIDTKHAANPEHDAPGEQQEFDTVGAELMNKMHVLRQRMTNRDTWPTQVQEFAVMWDHFKGINGMMDFTDLIEQALKRSAALEGCRILFVDEAQDMSKLEFALARKWGAAAEQIVVVGDPDQNLYQWRGSDPAAFYEGKAVTTRVLSQSYRVPRTVHACATQWIKQVPDRVDAAYEPTSDEGSVTKERMTWKSTGELIQSVTSCEGSVMVLTSCGYMLTPLLKELKRQAIPFHNPYRVNHGGWNPLRAGRRLLAFQRPSWDVWGKDCRMWTWRDLWAWIEPMQAKGYLTRGAKNLVESRVAEGISRFDDSKADEKVPIDQLNGLFLDDHLERVYEMDLAWWEQSLLHSRRKQQQFPLAVARAGGAAQLRETPRIIVGTIHSVKGGEADHVYLFPDLSTKGYWGGWKIPGVARSATVRQFYVGMTRSRSALHLCAAASPLCVTWQ